MEQWIRRLSILALFSLTLLCATVAVATAEEGGEATGGELAPQELLPSEVSVLRSLHFSGPDGGDVLVPPGIYLVEQAPDSRLRLSPREGEPVVVLAEQVAHEESLDGVLALGEETEEDEYHVVLMLPGGIAHDAVASYSGIVARDTRRRILNTAQIGRARARVKRLPVPSLGVARTTRVTALARVPGKGVAPWLYIAEEKKGYYVYPQFALPAAREQLSRPIADERYRRFVRDRAAAFRVAGRALPLVVDDNAIVDVGGSTLDRSNTAALVDLARSPGLDAMIQESIGVKQRDAYYINAFLVSSFAFDLPAAQQSEKEKYRYGERILVDVAAKDHGRTALWMLEEGKWSKLYDVPRPRRALQDPRRKLLELRSGQQPRHLRGYERVALEEQEAAGPQKLVFGAARLAKLPEIYCDSSGCRGRRSFQSLASALLRRPVDSSAMDAFHCDQYGCQRVSEASSTQQPDSSDSGSGSAGSPDNLPPPPGQSDAADSSASQPLSYTSWGDPARFTTWASCNRRCSRNDCQSCCNIQMAIEQGIIAQAAIVCHILSDFCPWCHVGCAAATATVSIPLLTLNVLCSGNCGASYEEEGPNPYHCSEH